MGRWSGAPLAEPWTAMNHLMGLVGVALLFLSCSVSWSTKRSTWAAQALGKAQAPAVGALRKNGSATTPL